LKTQLYFWRALIKTYKKELSLATDYYNRTKNQFDNIEKEVDDYVNSLYDNYPGTEDTDPASVAEWAQKQGEIMYYTLSTMKSNHRLMTIVMLCNTWEQQLAKFIIQELQDCIEFEKRVLGFNLFKKIFKLHSIDIEKLESWKKIKELRLLTNTIKHAEGTSAENLRKIRPDFFEHDFITGEDTLILYGAVLMNANSLIVKENDLKDYTDSTMKFWDEMPERASSDINSITNALNE
jgi:hypothetical protein